MNRRVTIENWLLLLENANIENFGSFELISKNLCEENFDLTCHTLLKSSSNLFILKYFTL